MSKYLQGSEAMEIMVNWFGKKGGRRHVLSPEPTIQNIMSPENYPMSPKFK